MRAKARHNSQQKIRQTKSLRAQARQAGDTIIEVLIAVAVVSAVLSGAFLTTSHTVKNIQQSQEHEEALGLLQGQMERLKVVTKDRAAAAPFFATDSPFCLSTANAKVDIAGSSLPAAAYPAQCTFGPGNRYNIGIIQLRDGSGAHNNVFSAQASWVGPTGANDRVNILYRLFPGSIATVVTPPLPPGPTPMPPPPGTCTGSFVASNIVQNGDFSISPGAGPGTSGAAWFTTTIPNRGPNIYPDDGGINGAGPHPNFAGGYSVWDHPFTTEDLGGHTIVGRPFSGDATLGVPAASHYFYSNPNQKYPPVVYNNAANFTGMLWQQQNIPVEANTTYYYFIYVDNLLDPADPDNATSANPIIELRKNNAVLVSTTVPKTPDQWIRYGNTITTGAGETSIDLSIWDMAGNANGDDFGLTAVTLYKCVP
jgi:type II secretory pathway pseudopilin PulG